jgi:hypothetical protein
MVVPRHELRAKLIQLMGLLLHTNPAADVVNLPAGARRRPLQKDEVSGPDLPDPTVPDAAHYDPEEEPAK